MGTWDNSIHENWAHRETYKELSRNPLKSILQVEQFLDLRFPLLGAL